MVVPSRKGDEVSASTAYMAGIRQVLSSIHCLCALGHDAWILDSGASDHMCSEETLLHDFCLLYTSDAADE